MSAIIAVDTLDLVAQLVLPGLVAIAALVALLVRLALPIVTSLVIYSAKLQDLAVMVAKEAQNWSKSSQMAQQSAFILRIAVIDVGGSNIDIVVL